MRTCEKCEKEHDGSYASGRFCSRSCANTKIFSEASKQKKSKTMKGRHQGATRLRKKVFLEYREVQNVENREIDTRYFFKKVCPVCGKEYTVVESYKKKIYCSKRCYNLDHTHQFRKQTKGGLRKGSGRGKSGWYKGYWCDSSYELAWVIYNLEHNIKFERNITTYKYWYKDKEYSYYPDFIKDGELIEIKGFLREKDNAKFSAVKDNKLLILFEKDLKTELGYVISKYGVDYIRLYEINTHSLKKNKCEICGGPAKNKYCSRVCAGKSLHYKLIL